MNFWIWITMVFLDLLIPVAMIIIGAIFSKSAPKKINSLYGYRTTMSMKNKDTWEFAHHYFGKLWFKIGIVLALVTLIPIILMYGKDEDFVGAVGTIISLVQIVPLIYPIFPTEKALSKTFDKDGNRIN